MNFLDLKIKRKNITNYLLNFFVFSAVLLPAGTYNLKIISLVLLVLFNIKVIISFFLRKSNVLYLLFIIIFPILLILISLPKNNNIFELIRYFYIFSYLLVIPIVEKWRLDFKKILMTALTILALIIVISALLDFSGIITVNSNPILNFIKLHGEGQISVSQYAIFRYVIFLNASPLILISFSYFLFEGGHLFLAAINFLALAFSGTRANIYLSFVVIGIYILFNNKNIILKIFILIASFLMIIQYFQLAVEKISTISWAKESGDEIRRLTMKSIIDSLNSKIENYIFGMGARTFYFNYGRGYLVNESELTYLELLRQIGLIGLIPFMIFIGKPLINFFKLKDLRWLFLSYSLYLIKCFFDPFLFTSTGFMLIILVYVEYENIKVTR